MHEYDIALKLILQASTDSTIRQLAGVSVVRWLNVEMPQVLSSRADLLGATSDGDLIHIELQSTNDPDMALRMADTLCESTGNSENSPNRSSCMWVSQSCA